MTRLLSLFGLMRVSEHERLIETSEQRGDRWYRKYITALKDLAGECTASNNLRANLLAAEAELADLRPDALAMRRKRQRDRDLKAAKATGKSTT